MSFLPAFQFVGSEAAPRLGFILHGALGSGQNFRAFARRLNEAKPDLGLCLVDLRNHGASHPAPAPHTLASCALDLVALSQHLGRVPDVLIGHSFGGKVVLEYLKQAHAAPQQVWVLDAVPGTQPVHGDNEIRRVLRAVRSVPLPIVSRQAVVAAMLQQGLSSGLANWMSTNVRRQGDQYAWSLSLEPIEELLVDYFTQDMWPLLENVRTTPKIHLVIAQHSDRWTAELRRRAADLGPETGVVVHHLDDAGHWLHVDNPDGLFTMMAAEL